MYALILICLFSKAFADLGDSNPPTGSCLCIDGTGVRVRDNPGLSSNIIGSVNTGQCFKYLGSRLTADGYRWFKVEYGSGGWIAGNYMNHDSDSRCSTGSCGSDSSRLSHSAAASMLSSVGITISSSCGCSNRQNPCCTSLDTIRCKCITDMMWFKQTSGCTVRVTGGTEVGHASGSQSHYNGYKLDIGLSSCIDGYIVGNFPYIGTRPDGARMYRDSRRNVYAKEGNHWDILYPD